MRAEQNRVQGAVNLIWTCAPFRTMSLDPSVMIAFALTQLCGLLSRHPVCVETVNGCLTLFSVKFETPSYLLDSKVTYRQFARPTNEQKVCTLDMHSCSLKLDV